MKSILIIIASIICLVVNVGANMLPVSRDEIQSCFPSASSITIIHNNATTTFSKGSESFDDLLQSFLHLLEGSHQMPAYGVSLHEETLKELQTETFIQFNFPSLNESWGMSFDNLLIKIQPEFNGINCIRKHENKYEGRVYYLSLNKKCSDFYQKLTKNA